MEKSKIKITNKNLKPKNIYFGGVSGVGKTTFLKSVKKKIPQIKIIHGTTLLAKYLGMEKCDYDKIRKMNQRFLREKYGEAVLDQIEKNKNSIIIFDSHYLNMRWGKISRVAGAWIKKIDMVVLLKGDTEEILSRIRNDIKDRALFPVNASEDEKKKKLKNFLIMTEREFNRISSKYNLKKIVLNYKNDSTDFLKILSKG